MNITPQEEFEQLLITITQTTETLRNTDSEYFELKTAKEIRCKLSELNNELCELIAQLED